MGDAQDLISHRCLRVNLLPENLILMRWIACAFLAAAGGAAAGCDRAGAGVEVRGTGVADTILPREEALRRFQENLPAVTALEGAHPSRDELVNSFISALRRRDTMALNSMQITSAEFAYLYYPTNPQSLPPYDLEPGLMWWMLLQRSDRGIRRALARYGGREIELLRYDCGREVSREGANIISGPCVMQVRDERGQALAVRLLGGVIERGGRFKVLSFSNEL